MEFYIFIVILLEILLMHAFIALFNGFNTRIQLERIEEFDWKLLSFYKILYKFFTMPLFFLSGS